jgi:hypothetical protein
MNLSTEAPGYSLRTRDGAVQVVARQAAATSLELGSDVDTLVRVVVGDLTGNVRARAELFPGRTAGKGMTATSNAAGSNVTVIDRESVVLDLRTTEETTVAARSSLGVAADGARSSTVRASALPGATLATAEKSTKKTAEETTALSDTLHTHANLSVALARLEALSLRRGLEDLLGRAHGRVAAVEGEGRLGKVVGADTNEVDNAGVAFSGSGSTRHDRKRANTLVAAVARAEGAVEVEDEEVDIDTGCVDHELVALGTAHVLHSQFYANSNTKKYSPYTPGHRG